jgi:acetylornithine deacetylase/succinyl-diaminopimelate desuccinylase-like protein
MIAAEVIGELAKLRDLPVPDLGNLESYITSAAAQIDSEYGAGASAIVRKVTVNPGLIQGGVKVNMVAAECMFEVDIRIPNGLTAEAIGRLKVAWRPFAGNTLLDAEVRQCCEAALAAFRELGCVVEQQDEPIANAEPAWRVLQQSNWAARFHARLRTLVISSIQASSKESVPAGHIQGRTCCGRPTSEPSIIGPCRTGSSNMIWF